MKIVLHACCGPCSTIPIDDFLKEGHEIVVYYANSNIQPESEYIRRRDTIAAYAREKNIEFVEGIYNPNLWFDAIGQNTKYSVDRCRACYALRFKECAEYAAKNDACAIASSLTISPYQFTDVINEELKRACEIYGIKAIESDYRSRYEDSVKMSREAGMYRQNYCGCIYSLVEATEQRIQRRRERKLAKERTKLANQQ